MGMGRLNVWISGMDDPCAIDDRLWFVTIYNCDGKVLEWCGRRYVVMPAKCGHLEVEVPPGCYRVSAVWNYIQVPELRYWANHFAESAIVQVGCDQTACVKLFNPSAHRCGYIYLLAVRDLVKQGAVAPETAERLEGALKEALEQIPEPAKPFELGHLDEIERLVRERGG